MGNCLECLIARSGIIRERKEHGLNTLFASEVTHSRKVATLVANTHLQAMRSAQFKCLRTHCAKLLEQVRTLLSYHMDKEGKLSKTNAMEFHTKPKALFGFNEGWITLLDIFLRHFILWIKSNEKHINPEFDNMFLVNFSHDFISITNIYCTICSSNYN